MNAYITNLLALFIAFFLQASITFAQPNTSSPSFTQYDIDQDGSVNYGEYLQWHEQWVRKGFLKLDKNGDGSITKDEYSEFTNERHQQMNSRKSGAMPLK